MLDQKFSKWSLAIRKTIRFLLMRVCKLNIYRVSIGKAVRVYVCMMYVCMYDVGC